MPNAPKRYRPLGQQTEPTKRRRATRIERGYDARWTKFSAWLRKQPAQAVCALCDQAAAEHIDHVEAVRGPNDERFYHLANLIGLCHRCHSRKTALCDGSFGNASGSRGRALLARLKAIAAQRAAAIEATMGHQC